MAVDVRIRREVDARLDDVVELAHSLVDRTEIYKKFCSDCHKPVEGESCPRCRDKQKRLEFVMEKSQLRNLLGVVCSTESLKVVENFVRYQMGRSGGWRTGHFGDSLLGNIWTELKKLAEEAARGDESRQKVLHLEFVRRYAGYLLRYFVAQRGLIEGRGAT